MKGKIVHLVSKPHFCPTPFFMRKWWKGTVWECDCGKRWEVRFDIMGDKYWSQQA